MKNLKFLTVAVLVIIATIGAYSYPKAQTSVIKEVIKEVGAVVSPDIYDHITLHQNYTTGGTQVATSSTATTYTLTTKEIRKEVSYVSWTVNVNTTLTTMASTSAPLSNLKTGESFSTYFYNASTTAASTATFACGTGVDCQETEGSDLIVNGLEIARLNFLKKADNDVIFWIEVGQVGD